MWIKIVASRHLLPWLYLILIVASCHDQGPGKTIQEAAPGVTAPAGWKPKQSDLLFTSNRDGNSEIYLLKAGENEWTNLSNHPGPDNWPEWSPDGARIAFQSRRSGSLDIWVMNADGGEQLQLTDHPEHDYLPSWTPDGTRIVFTSWRNEAGEKGRANHIYIMNADGSDQRRLVPDSPRVSAGAIWSPDGGSFLLNRKTGENSSDLFLLNQQGQVLQRLTEDAAFNGSPAFSPDGSRIAYYSDGGELAQIVVMNADGSESRTLATTVNSWYPRWSPDGRWLTYTAAANPDDPDDLDIFAISLEAGATPIKLVGGSGRESESRWRPQP